MLYYFRRIGKKRFIMSEEPQEYEAQEPLPYIPSASFQQDVPLPPVAQPAEQTVSAPSEPSSPAIVDRSHVQRKRRRGPWIVALIVLLALVISAFFVIRYINRSTPTRTLATFCNALRQQDYQTAYNQFSQNLQKTFSESTFASNFSSDRVTACSYTPTRSNGNSVTTSMRIVHGPAGVNNDVITLSADSNQVWKIDDFYRI
jgi:limonene-1,2-epoxide hydrolase